jgi:hypothetical protein
MMDPEIIKAVGVHIVTPIVSIIGLIVLLYFWFRD